MKPWITVLRNTGLISDFATQQQFFHGERRMFVRRSIFATLALLVLLIGLTAGAWAQNTQAAPPSAPQPQAAAPQSQQFVMEDYSKPRSHFPNPIAPYMPTQVSPPNVTNTPRISTLMRDGKIYLSMDDAVALALENNLDIAIARYNLNIADTDVLRSKAGGNILGVNTGVVQNTPGGGVGGLSGSVGSGAGGTTVGAGGAGSGTLGLVSSTLGIGSSITSFDPILTGTLQMDRAYALSTSAFNGVGTINQNTGTANFAYTQGFQTGTNLSVGFNNSHVTTNVPFTTFTPLVQSYVRAQVTQHLLQGFGFTPNKRFIIFAKNNREISDVAFRLQVITTVDQIENMYWDLVFAYQNVRVQQESLAFAQKTLSDTQKQVQIGTMAPIQVVGAQSTVATDQRALTVAQTNLELQQLLMKNALSRTLVDPSLADAEVIPTSTMVLPDQEPVSPTEQTVNDALGHRAELAESRIDLKNREINNQAVRNSMLPSLDLYAYYQGSGIGGNINPCAVTSTPSATCPNPAGGFGPVILPPPFQNGGPVSYSDTLSQTVNSTAPDKGVGLLLTIPLRNRLGQANQVRAQLEYRQAQMRLQQLENQVRIEVRNAQFTLQQNRAAVSSAQAAVEFARQTLDAEQKKLALGASTTTAVLQDQSAFTTAESTLVSAQAAYEKSVVEVDRATGLLLDHAGIQVPDAERGEVTHMPKVPDVQPRQDIKSVMPPTGQSAPAPAPATPQQ
jgi:outer membrane protein TolC